MHRRTSFAAALGAGAVLLAACSPGDSTTIGPPESIASQTTASATSPAASPAAGPAATSAATAVASKFTGGSAAGLTYKPATFDVPLATAGWATVHTSVPVGWTLHTSTGGGPLYASSAATFDRRDPSGNLLVRFDFRPTATPGQSDGAVLATIASSRSLPGARVTVTKPPYRGEDSGLTQADWTVRLAVEGKPRLVLMRAWLLDNEVITAYVSVPDGSSATAAQLFAHAGELSYELHADPSPTPAAG